jgi:hypothetical protein
MDCPYYEQLQYVGDTRLEALVTYATTRDDRLPRKAIVMFDLSREASGLTRSRYPDFARQIIPTFSLLWVAMVHDWAMYRTGGAFLRERMRGVRGVIDFFVNAIDQDGLLVAPKGWNFVDWVTAEGWELGTPPAAEAGGRSGIYQFLLAYVMRLAAQLETMVGEPELSARAARIAKLLCEAGHAAFWDDQRKLYADDPGKRFTSEHAQCFSLLAGAVPAQHVEHVHHALRSVPLARATIYFTHYLFEAMRLLGDIDTVFERLGLWFALRSQGLYTTPETPEPTRSDCHAWGAHPIYHYGATILGIRPSAPGFAEVTIEPRLGPLMWARGTVPHPNGEIYAEMRRVGTDLQGAVRVPEGVRGKLVLGARSIEIGPGQTAF